MWTQEHRKTYVRVGGRYPSDMTDAEWALLEPLIPAAKHGGRPRKTDMRAAINAILYLLRTGCPWRYLPRDGFPPRSTVYNIFRNFQKDGVWTRSGTNCAWSCVKIWSAKRAPRRRSSTVSR